MEKLPATTLLKIFDFAFDQNKRGKKAVKYGKFFKVIAESRPNAIDHIAVLNEISEKYKENKNSTEGQNQIKNLQKQRDRINKTLKKVYGYEIVNIHNKHGESWKLAITNEFCKALIGKSDIELDTILKNWQENFGESKNSSKIIKRSLKIEDQLQKVPNSKLIKRFHLRRNQIVVRIHEEYAIELDAKTRSALDILNLQRQNEDLEDIYPGRRFRLICPPSASDSEVILDLAPISFACFSLLEEEKVPDEIKDHITNRINNIACRISPDLKSSHTILNAQNYVPLGVQFVLLTKDGQTLIRKRGKHEEVSKMAWSMSFGGYCYENDIRDSEFDICFTVKQELKREIGFLAADPRDIIFTGLHCNILTGSINILGFWKLEARTDELVNLITETDYYPGTMEVFETTRKSEEPYVWDNKNIIVNFQVSDISKMLKKIKPLGGDLIPECFVALILALEANGHSTSELFQ